MELHSPSGLLATAGDDAVVRVWHLPSLARCPAGQHAAAQRACLAAHSRSVHACSFTSCGAFLATASLDGTVRLWRLCQREPLAVLQLAASSVAWMPGDDAILLAAHASPGQAPALLDLRHVPACRLYCAQLEEAGAAAEGGAAGGGQEQREASAPRAALHPTAAMWLPSGSPPWPSLGPSTAAPAAAAPSAAVIPSPLPAAASAQPAPAASQAPGSSGTRRQVGSLATYEGRRCRRQLEAEEAEEEHASVAAGPAEAAAGGSSWLPAGRTPLQPTAAHRGAGGGPLGGWGSPLSPPPSSPPCDDGRVPEAAMALRYQAPPAAGTVWSAASRQYVNQQVGVSLWRLGASI